MLPIHIAETRTACSEHERLVQGGHTRPKERCEYQFSTCNHEQDTNGDGHSQAE